MSKKENSSEEHHSNNMRNKYDDETVETNRGVDRWGRDIPEYHQNESEPLVVKGY